MIEVRIGWEASYRHDELPFACPRSAGYGQKVSSWKRNCCDQVDFCPCRGPEARFALSELTTKLEAGTTVGISGARFHGLPAAGADRAPRGRNGGATHREERSSDQRDFLAHYSLGNAFFQNFLNVIPVLRLELLGWRPRSNTHIQS